MVTRLTFYSFAGTSKPSEIIRIFSVWPYPINSRNWVGFIGVGSSSIATSLLLFVYVTTITIYLSTFFEGPIYVVCYATIKMFSVVIARVWGIHNFNGITITAT